MKKSIAFLPKKNREDLKYLVELILDKIPVCEMIILYGSYARGTYVSYDEREEFGIPTSFKSDYDILVINSAWSYDKIENKLASVRNIYDKRGDHRYRVPVQFIHDSIKKVNEDLKYSRYFYTELKRDGIMLYNRGKNKLARRKPLKFGEIKKQGEEYFGEKYAKARLFMEQAVFMYDTTIIRDKSTVIHILDRSLYIFEMDKLFMISIIIKDSFIAYYPSISFRIGMQIIITCKIIISHYLTRILRETINSQMCSNPQTTAICLLNRMNDIVTQRLFH